MSENNLPVLASNTLEAQMQYANTVAVSDLLPTHYRGKPANVLIALQYADALRIHPVQALNDVIVINGKPSMSANLMSAIVRNAGHRLRVVEDTDSQRVTAVLIRCDDPDFQYEVVWDARKATVAGLWGKSGPWKQYPMQMLRARAISEVCRQGASDALMGVLYVPEELGHVEPAQSAPAPVAEVEVVSGVRDEIMREARNHNLTGQQFAAKLHELYGADVTWNTASDQQLQTALTALTSVEVEVIEPQLDIEVGE